MPEQYKMVAENPQSTVVSDFEPVYRKSTQYQSEAEMEHDFISQLEKQGYEYLPIKTEKELICNLRRQLECLNDYKFTDNEWTVVLCPTRLPTAITALWKRLSSYKRTTFSC